MSAIRKNPLSALSASQIINRLDTLVQKERETTLEVLCHIIEMDRRSLYLGRGYASLFEYCMQHLGYSESAASRRIKTARCIRDFPEIYDMLSNGELSLSIVCKLSGILTEKNKQTLLADVRCRSARQVDAIIAHIRPTNILRERVRPVYVRKPTESQASISSRAENRGSSVSKSDQKFTADVGGKKLATFDKPHNPSFELEQKFKLEFSIEPGVMKKLEQARALLSKKYPSGLSIEMLFEFMLDEYLEKHSPERKIQRREKRKAKEKSKQKKSSAVKKMKESGTKTATRKNNNSGAVKFSRHILQAVQDKVFMRDGGRCTFVGSNGVRCDSTWNLEIDHIKPFARGGGHSIDNLRLLCAKHNKLAAERIFGREFMNRRMHDHNQDRSP
jgi:5-methylcytosine-specific restriction endonuclease McrA